MRRIGLAMAVLGVVGACAGAWAGEVRLYASARAPAGPITLGQVAALSGDDAQEHAGVVVVLDDGAAAGGRGWIEVSLEDVRRALREAGVPTGRLAMSGGRCVVRLEGAPAPLAPRAAEVGARERPAEVVDVGAEHGLVRGRAAEAVAVLYGVDWRDVRLRFDARDDVFLAQAVGGRIVAVEPQASPSSSRIVLAVRIYEGASLVEMRSIRADAEVRCAAVLLTADVARGGVIGRDSLDVREMWVSPAGGLPVGSPEEAEGMLARSRLSAGSVLRTADLEPPLMVRRGEFVTVSCLVSGCEVRTRARAMADARRGEIVELRREGSKKSFSACVDGPGRAVLSVERSGAAPDEER